MSNEVEIVEEEAESWFVRDYMNEPYAPFPKKAIIVVEGNFTWIFDGEKLNDLL